MKYLAITAITACFILFAGVTVFLCFSYISEYRPAECETIYDEGSDEHLNDTLTLLTWNIGYGGLGSNMDFFYDGGTKVRDTKMRTLQNFDSIKKILLRSDADIIMLQEVDLPSKRSYFMNQLKELETLFPDRHTFFSYNYKVNFVPIPLNDPIGRVRSGSVTISKIKPITVSRFQYPGGFTIPNRLFNLKRGLLTTLFLSKRGDTVAVNNTHNSAFDDGDTRRAEIRFLHDLLIKYRKHGIASITGGDWNQFPPQYTPRKDEISNKYFSPQKITGTLFDNNWMFVYDSDNISMRFMDKPLDKNPTLSLTDFFLISSDMEIVDIKTINTHLQFSDHNPVMIRIKIK